MKYTFLIFIGILLIGEVFLFSPAPVLSGNKLTWGEDCPVFNDIADDCSDDSSEKVNQECSDADFPKCIITERVTTCSNGNPDRYATGKCCVYNYGFTCNDTGTVQCDGTCSAKSYVPCGTGDYGFPGVFDPDRCSGTTVSANCGEGESKCLSERQFVNSDRINDKSLVCCNSQRYNIIDDTCTLVNEASYDADPNLSCEPPTPLTAEGFALCDTGLSCSSDTELGEVGGICPNGANKCLSDSGSFGFAGADKINGYKLICCNAQKYDFINGICTLVVDGPYTTSNCTTEPSDLITTCDSDAFFGTPIAKEDGSGRLNCSFPPMFYNIAEDRSSAYDEINYTQYCNLEAYYKYPNYTASCNFEGVEAAGVKLNCCFTGADYISTIGSSPPIPTPDPSLCCPDGSFNCYSASDNINACCLTTQPFGTVDKIPCTAVTSTPPSSTPAECQVITSPPSLDLLSGESSVSVADVTGLGSATINQMHFGVYENPPGTIIATVDPISDSNSPYSTRVSLITNGTTWRTGTTAVWATADLSDGRTCQSSGTTDTDISISAVISVKVFNDDGDGVQETGEGGTAGAIVTLTQPNESQPAESRTINAGSSGSVAFLRIPGNYTLTVTVPSGYTISNSGSQIASMIINNLSQNMTYSFPIVPPPGSSSALTPQVCDWEGDNAGAYCITADGGPGTCDSLGNCSPGYSPSYSISGKLFVDNYEDTQSTGDTNYTNSVAVTVKKGEETFAVTKSGGTYTSNNLPAGDYTIKFSGLPEGWRFTYPNTPDNSLQVQVGPTCEYPITTSEASCRP